MTGVRADKNGDGIELDLQVVPRASRESLGPLHGERIKLHVTAPPVDGAANEAVRALVARLFAVPRAEVRITRGETGRQKTVRIEGPAQALLAQAEALLGQATTARPEPSDRTGQKDRPHKKGKR